MLHHLTETTFITEEEYLAGEALADEKHEYLNGFVYPLHGTATTNMAGATDAHVKISLNVAAAVKSLLRGTGCSTYMADMRGKINAKDKAWFYPDVMVTCDQDDRKRKTMKQSPIFIVEVLSQSTRDYDRGDKFAVYRTLPTLREYVLIDSSAYSVEVFRLNEHRRWELFSFEDADSRIEFSSIGFHSTLADIYEDVDFA